MNSCRRILFVDGYALDLEFGLSLQVHAITPQE
jgi:hypothetical protein